MITFKSVNVQRISKLLLNSVDFRINAGEHVGLVGANGSGKSSLLMVLQNQLQIDQGSIDVDYKIGIAHMEQEIEALQQNALDYVLDGDYRLREIQKKIEDAEKNTLYEKLADLYESMQAIDGYTAESRAIKMLEGLGFESDQLTYSVKKFSGGWRMRLNLARTLMTPSDLMLLDEPTNHLDLNAIVWLEIFLKRYNGTLIIISHDRDFLDNVCDMILHLENKKITTYRGNYSKFEVMKCLKIQQEQKAQIKLQKKREHMESFVRRFKAKASKAKQAQSRVKALAKLGERSAILLQSPFSFNFFESEKISSPLLTINQGVIGYLENVILEANFSILPNDRIALVGKNGAGKSTLIKTLMGDLPLLQGEIVKGEHLKIGYFAQHQLESLCAEHSPINHLMLIDPQAKEQTLRNFLGGFGFNGQKAFDPIVNFSGGEKARLSLAMMTWQKPNLLLLDEPTNHLDIDMRDALNIALQDFKGAVILISHDRSLINCTTNELLLIRNKKLISFEGSLEAALQEESDNKTYLNQKNQQCKASDKKTFTKKEIVKNRKEKVFIQNKIKNLEIILDQLGAELEDIQTQLRESFLYTGDQKEKLNTLLINQDKLSKSAKDKEEELLGLLEKLESLQ